MQCPIHKKSQCKKGEPFRIGIDCRICWLAVHSGAYRFANFENGNPVSIERNVPCLHRGDQIPITEGQRRGLTHLKIWYECEKGHGPQCQCNRSCGPLCPDYVADNESPIEAKKVRHVQNASYPTVGISIGSYGMPGVIELQAAVIRQNCGQIPILVSDDHTEEAGDDGFDKKLRILDICEKYNLIYKETAPNRIGHAGGDLGSFYHGLTYAAENKIDYWLKLSQRFICERPQFVQKCAAILRDNSEHTMSQIHQNRGLFYFAMRTEFVLMDVSKWHRADIMEKLKPRPLGRAAEDVIYDCVRTIGGHFFASPLFTGERSKHHSGLLWYEADGNEGYVAMAEKYGVDLGPGFHAGGSVHSPGFKWG